jgi:hypothetical protein
MSKIVRTLFALLLAAALCTPAYAVTDNAGTAAHKNGEKQAKKKPANTGKTHGTKKKANKKNSKNVKKDARKKQAPPKKSPATPAKGKEPTPAEKAGTVRNEAPGRFSTPPPGTGYGSLENESPPPPPAR